MIDFCNTDLGCTIHLASVKRGEGSRHTSFFYLTCGKFASGQLRTGIPVFKIPVYQSEKYRYPCKADPDDADVRSARSTRSGASSRAVRARLELDAK